MGAFLMHRKELNMGGRGGKSGMGVGGGGTPGGAIKAGERDVDSKKAGASFNKLPRDLQSSINSNLKMGDHLKSGIKKDGLNTKTSETWETKVGRTKYIVHTEIKDGRLGYTVKHGNKVIQKHTTKERAANTVAKMYLDEMKKQRGR